ncbi:MAG: protein kinase [Chitinispirillaceae bacterium]|nr:protein kinase [Chitinispirillaceae bacterium]
MQHKESLTKYLLKLIKSSNNDLNKIEIKKRFYHEINIVSSFDHPNIGKPIDTQIDEDAFAIIYPYEKGNTLAQLFHNRETFTESDSLHIIKQLLFALEYIHERGIVHADINPYNIYVTEEKGVYLLDFGLSMTEEEANKIPEGRIVGTFPYLAPEQMGFTKFKIDRRTDLFCTVIILYKMIAGKLPFQMQEDSIKDLLDAAIKRDIVGIKHIPQYLNEIIIKGLRPTPADRYQTVEGLLYDLSIAIDKIKTNNNECFVIGQKDAIAAINRKRLFVVRENELALLQNGIKHVVKEKEASYLLYGKSGIGKTELVKEFKIKADEMKVDFLTARCNRFTPTQPYSIYRQIIIEFILNNTCADKDEKNSIRKSINKECLEYSGIICKIVPEMKDLFDTVHEIGIIEKDKEADRIIHVLTEFIEKLCKLKKTILFIDDFQWVDRITSNIVLNLIDHRIPIMVVCNYRIAENNENLFCFERDLRTCGFTKIIKVNEFTIKETTELVLKRFGQIEEADELIRMLHTKTDGVPFVLTEAIRYLVNDALLTVRDRSWFYKKESVSELPDKFDPVSLIMQKLNGLNDEEKEFLKVSSLIEGKIDCSIIEKIINKKTCSLSVIASRLESMGLIVMQINGGYTFIHNRIQESISGRIEINEKYNLYELIGDIYYKIAITDKEKIFNAAEYFLKSKNAKKAMEICYQAALYATEKIAFDVAIRYFKRLTLLADQKQAKSITSIDLIQAKITFGDVLALTGANEQALNVFNKIYFEEKTINKYQKLQVSYKIGSIYHNIGDFELSTPYFISALNSLGIKIHKNNVSIIRGLMFEIVKLFVKPIWLTFCFNPKSDQWRLLKLRILNKLSYSMYFKHMIASMYLQFLANNLADRVVDSYEKAEAYSMHGIASYQIFMKKRAFKYHNKSSEIARKIHRQDVLAFSKSFGGLCYYYNGSWRKSEILLSKSIELFSSIGDLNSQIISKEHIWKIDLMKGKIETILDDMQKTITLCNRVHDQYFMVVTMAAQNLVKFLKNGKHDKKEYAEIHDRLKKFDSILFHIEAGNYLLNNEIELGKYKRAYERATILLPLILKKCINSEYQVRSYNLFCYLIVKELLDRKSGIAQIGISSKILKKKFINNSFIHWFSCLNYPAYWGSYHRNLAWFCALQKHKWLAHHFFKKAIKAHHKLDMRYEEACSIRDYGRFLDDFCDLPGEARDRYTEAYKIFQWCGAKLETDRLEEYLHTHRDRKQTFIGHMMDTEVEPVFDVGSSSGVNLLRFETLVDVSKTITETDDPSILMRQILSAMITATGAQYGGLFINKYAYDGLEPIAMTFEGNEVPINEVPVFTDLINKVNEIHTLQCTGETAVDNDTDTDSTYIRSDLCVPLNWRDKYLGYVYLVNDRVRGLFGEGAQKAAMVLAAQAGILLENAALLRKQREFNEELQQQVASQTKDILHKNQQLEDANLKLIESERMKGILSGTLVHDIKNYAAGITGNLIYLSRRMESDPKAQRVIDVVCETCTDITSMASNLLDIAKMDDGKLVVKEELIDFQFFEGVAEKFGKSALFDEKEIVTKIVPPEEDFIISADVYLMERVLQNLYSNAAKYAPKGSSVELRFHHEGGENIVCFFNSGTPIPDSEKEIMFEKYARLQTRQSPYSKGLGLFFCRMVVQAHHGRIWLDTDQSGNYFKLAFPRKDFIRRLNAAS